MGAFDDMYMCSDCGIVTVPRFDPHECKMPTGVARTFKGALDRERAKLAEARALLARLGDNGGTGRLLDDVEAWLAANPDTEAR